jgi:hypothetical protein
MPAMLLIYPPSARCPEPPLGIAKLAGFLRSAGREAMAVDLCLEGVEYLAAMDAAAEEGDAWSAGALKRRGRALSALREPHTYGNPARYGRFVRDLGRALKTATAPWGIEASLADYADSRLSPLKKIDLLAQAARFEENPFFPLFERRIGPLLGGIRDGWVGISICYLSQALCGFALAGYVKSRAPGLKIAMGGGLVSSWLAGAAFEPERDFPRLVDAAVSGPGELWLSELFGIDAASASASPDYGDFRLDDYLAPLHITPYSFSSGCPWKRCSFCPERAEDLPYRGIRAPKAIDELGAIVDASRPGLIHFSDNEVSPLYMRALAEAGFSTPWYGFARFSAALLDEGFCLSLAASGCVMLQLGLESGDQEVLDAMGKGTKIVEIERILANLHAAGVGAYLYVLFGTPTETREGALRTRDFIAARAAQIDFLNLALFNLPAQAEEIRGLSTSGFYDGDLSLYREFDHPEGWNRPQVRRFLSEDFNSVPEIRAITTRTPPVFTSNHAPLFLDRMEPSLREASSKK